MEVHLSATSGLKHHLSDCEATNILGGESHFTPTKCLLPGVSINERQRAHEVEWTRFATCTVVAIKLMFWLVGHAAVLDTEPLFLPCQAALAISDHHGEILAHVCLDRPIEYQT